MRILTVIMAHADAQEIFDRHLPIWVKNLNGSDMAVFCPEGSKVKCPDCWVYDFGMKEHHGFGAITRFRDMLMHLIMFEPADRFIIHEYDSIQLGPFDWIPGYLMGCFNPKGQDEPFKGLGACTPPLAMDREVMEKIFAVNLSCDAEFGYWDRWLTLAAEMAGVPIHSFCQHGIGFTDSTLLPKHYPAIREARKNGAVMFHGVKDLETLNVILGRE